MYLVEGINNDVVLSSLVSAGHMFLQQPTHPTFPALSRLIMTMSQCYSEEVTPSLPNPARKSSIATKNLTVEILKPKRLENI